MEWKVISQDRDGITEQAITDDGTALYRMAWYIPSLRPGLGQTLGFGMAAVPAAMDGPGTVMEAVAQADLNVAAAPEPQAADASQTEAA